jgi:phosphomannomutase
MALRENQQAELTDLYHQGVYPRVEADRIATVRNDDTAIDHHLAAVVAAVDAEAIRARRFSVVVDAVNGAASVAAPRLLELLGCRVVTLHTDLEQPFPHDPEPSPENLGDLSEAVKASAADLGFALDADGDRLSIVDGAGRALGEDCTLALAARHRLPHGEGPLVISASTSRMLDQVAADAGRVLVRTQVGEVYVVAAMLEHGATIGGEGNGGVILPEVNPGRDGMVGMALILEALAKSGRTVAELREALPHYQIVKRALPCPLRELGPSLRRLRRAYADEVIALTAGVTVVFGDRWLQARASKTEPILRIIAEAPERDTATRMAQEAAEVLRPVG